MSYQQIIYNKFRQYGMTESGALGMLGNFQEESGCEPNRLEHDYSPYRTNSKEYVRMATSGEMTKTEFCKPIGFGLAQWTYSTRKAELWEFWKNSNKALDDVYLQIDFTIKELKQLYPEIWKLLCTSNDLYTCVKRVCYDFENPAIKNVNTRFDDANTVKAMIDINNWNDSDEQIEQTPVINHDLILRTIDKNCSGFIEVEILKTILLIRNYNIDKNIKNIDTWSSETSNCILQFQKDYNLIADGIVGQKTWQKLLEIKG